MPLKLVIGPAEPPVTVSADQSQVPTSAASVSQTHRSYSGDGQPTSARADAAVDRHTLGVTVHAQSVFAADEVDALIDGEIVT